MAVIFYIRIRSYLKLEEGALYVFRAYLYGEKFVIHTYIHTYIHIHIYLYGVTMKMEEGLIPLLSYTHDHMLLSVVQLSQIQVVLL